jgi:hypothetical protein
MTIDIKLVLVACVLSGGLTWVVTRPAVPESTIPLEVSAAMDALLLRAMACEAR